MAPFDRSYTTYNWSAIVSIVLSCTIFEIKARLVENRDFFSCSLYACFMRFPSEYCYTVWCRQTRVVWLYPTVKNFEDMFSHSDTIPAYDGQAGGQTSCDGIVRAMHNA